VRALKSGLSVVMVFAMATSFRSGERCKGLTAGAWPQPKLLLGPMDAGRGLR
jgi:hypothetical protein